MSFDKNIDLNDEIITGITFKQCRDVFKKMVFDEFSMSEFSAWLYRDYVVDSCRNQWGFGDVNSVRSMFNGHLNVPDAIGIHGLNAMYRETVRLFDVMADMELVTQVSDEFWKVAHDGHSLRMQKCLKRIPRDRGLSCLKKMIKSIVAFNENEKSCLQIGAVWVYGSMLNDVPDVGDIDLAVDFGVKGNLTGRDDESYWYRMARKAVQVSPYISWCYPRNLNSLVKDGRADAELVFIQEGYELRYDFLPEDVSMPLCEELN